MYMIFSNEPFFNFVILALLLYIRRLLIKKETLEIVSMRDFPNFPISCSQLQLNFSVKYPKLEVEIFMRENKRFLQRPTNNLCWD